MLYIKNYLAYGWMSSNSKVFNVLKKEALMKRSMMIFACVITGSLYAAEQRIIDNQNSFKRTFMKTDIEVIKTNMKDVDLNQYSLVVVSKNQQRKFQRPDYGDIGPIGYMSLVPGNIIYTKNSQDDSRSDDDTYKPYTSELIAWDRQAERAERRALTTNVAVVCDPRIMFDSFVFDGSSTHGYFPYRSTEYVRFYAKDAIKEALIDLGKCYEKALEYGWDKMKDMSNKTIAIAPLGVGVPREEAAPVVVNAVFNFIQVKKSNLSYSKIVLLVRKRSELAEYKRLISKEVDTQRLVAAKIDFETAS